MIADPGIAYTGLGFVTGANSAREFAVYSVPGHAIRRARRAR